MELVSESASSEVISGNGDAWTLVKQGAEGRIFRGKFLERSCIVKERFRKTYRHPVLDERLTKERIRAELRGILRCKALGIRTPSIFLVDDKHNAIFMEEIDNAETVNVCIGRILQERNALYAQEELSSLASDVGVTVAKMHAAGIIHGDLTTSNILVDKTSRNLCLIDFGLSHVENSAEDKGVDLYVLERALTSTFSSIPWFFENLLQSYRKWYTTGGEDVFNKLEEIRLRGRKRTMVG